MEDVENVSSQESVDNNADNYIQALNELKQNSVNKDEYLKLKQENSRLVQELATNTYQPEQPKEVEPEVDIQALRNKLFGDKPLSNLDYISTALELRKELIRRGEPDPFTAHGKNYVATSDDIEKAEHVAEVLQEWVDYADGDNDVFRDVYQRNVVDTLPPQKRR